MNVTSSVRARVVVTGFHYWPDAPHHRAYLGQRHRHLFHITATIDVAHHDREVEVHDLQDHIRLGLVDIDEARPSETFDFGTRSCEQIAAAIASYLDRALPGRHLSVEVLEDGEAGAVVETGAA